MKKTAAQSKPVVKIRDWGIYRRYPDKPRPWALEGRVFHHPSFEHNTQVTTSSIIEPADSELSKLKDGDRVETKNTIYVLVGNNQNQSN